MASALLSVKYQVFGKVQGVFFRKYTHAKASSLGLKGWVMNTSQGTVIGEMQGAPAQINTMKIWLQEEGSPKSVVERVEFTEEQSIDAATYPSFEIRR